MVHLSIAILFFYSTLHVWYNACMELNHSRLLGLIENEQTLTRLGATPSFRQIASEINAAPSIFTRLRHGKTMSADALLRIIDWLGKRGCKVESVFTHITSPDYVIGTTPKRRKKK